MADAQTVRGGTDVYKDAAAAISIGELHQLADGRAGVYGGSAAAALADNTKWRTVGQYVVTKTTGIVILDGGPVFWDHSANAATYRKVSDRDFYIGTAVGDAASADATLTVNANVEPRYLIDLARDPFVTAPVGTQALGGFLPPQRIGGGLKFVLSATNEAQKVDALSKDGFATGANAIVEMAFAVVSDGAGTAPDASIGIANATHATDADSITDSIFVHLNGNEVNIYLESDDGTVEVAATDSTIDYTEGATNRVEVWFDMRNPADVQIYINGVLALASTVFNVSASVATWKLLAHLEKTAAADAYELDVDWLRVRTAEQ